MVSISLLLFGSVSAQQTARGILENQPQVRRMDCCADGCRIHLLLHEPLRESSLLPLLLPSGISGFRLLKE